MAPLRRIYFYCYFCLCFCDSLKNDAPTTDDSGRYLLPFLRILLHSFLN
jgi:hypothetical protein